MIGFRGLVFVACLATLAAAPAVLAQEEQENQEETGHTEIGGLFGIGLPASEAPSNPVEVWLVMGGMLRSS
ncbi:hypothetical protein [Candidatus Palauibacter sp.]|uniref:hypothetical protein n=1 Tax=Candidatus Palauibacter sp. TaxID=3101350 RepID=UPI003C6EBCBD